MGTPLDFVFTFTGALKVPFAGRGRYVRVLDAPSADLFLSFDSQGMEIQRGAGQSFDCGDFQFNTLFIRSTVAQTVRVSVSDQQQTDDRQNISATISATVDPGNTLETAADVSIAATSADVVFAGDANTRSVTVTSLDSNNAVIRVGELGSVGPTRGHPLYPGDSLTLATTQAIHAYNTGAAAQDLAVVAVKDV
jgi:hypothetical protein